MDESSVSHSFKFKTWFKSVVAIIEDNWYFNALLLYIASTTIISWFTKLELSVTDERKMDAKISCDLVLKHLKSSNLNFFLQETPFSAYITIRKSFIKDSSSAIPESNTESAEALNNKIKVLQAENVSLKTDLHKLKCVAKKSEDKISDLEAKIKNSQNKALTIVDDANKVITQVYKKQEMN